MTKGVYANSGLCLTCKRYHPKSLGNCKLVQDALEKCSFYLEKEDVSKSYRRKKRKPKKQEAEYITDEKTTINALLEKEKP